MGLEEVALEIVEGEKRVIVEMSVVVEVLELVEMFEVQIAGAEKGKVVEMLVETAEGGAG